MTTSATHFVSTDSGSALFIHGDRNGWRRSA